MIDSSLLETRANGSKAFVHDTYESYFLALYAIGRELSPDEITKTIDNPQLYFFYAQLTPSLELMVETLFDMIPYMDFRKGMPELAALQQCYKASPEHEYDFLETKYGLSKKYRLDDIISVLVWVPAYFDHRAKTDVGDLCSELDPVKGWNNILMNESSNLLILSSVYQVLQNIADLPVEVEEYLSSFMDAEDVCRKLSSAPDIYANILDLMSKGTSEHSSQTLLNIATELRPGWKKVIELLGNKGDPRNVPYLMEVLVKKPNKENGYLIAQAMRDIGSSCIPYLNQFTNQENPIQQIFAGKMIEELRSYEH